MNVTWAEKQKKECDFGSLDRSRRVVSIFAIGVYFSLIFLFFYTDIVVFFVFTRERIKRKRNSGLFPVRPTTCFISSHARNATLRVS